LAGAPSAIGGPLSTFGQRKAATPLMLGVGRNISRSRSARPGFRQRNRIERGFPSKQLAQRPESSTATKFSLGESIFALPAKNPHVVGIAVTLTDFFCQQVGFIFNFDHRSPPRLSR